MSTPHGTLTRAIAIDALTHVLTRNIHADTALDKLFLHHKNLRPLDRAFIFEIVYGSLRWLSKMDWIMSHMMDRPFASLDPRVANALRVGAYQIFYMDKVPDRAAVSETVEAVKTVGIPQASSFVNAILRRVARKAEYFPKPDLEKKPADYLSMHYAHPKWLVERWLEQMPLERLEHVLTANNTPADHTLRVIKRNPIPSGEDLGTYLLREHSIQSHWRPLKGALRVSQLPPFSECQAFREGCYIVQDESAQIISALINVTDKDSVLDACSAPGGKAIAIWDEGAEPKNMLLCDFSQKRIQTLQENLNRVKLSGTELVHGDAAEIAVGRTFTKIVLDAPCSALGVIRKHPESKWLRTPGDIMTCAREQERLLSGLAPAVAPGGELIYIVCSFEVEETSRQTEKFLRDHPQFEIVPLNGRIHDYYRKYVTKDNEFLVLPGNHDDLDGFYAVVLRRHTSDARNSENSFKAPKPQ